MTDFTFDLFHQDAQVYKATPAKGVYPPANSDDRKRFMVQMKCIVRDFTEEWFKTHSSRYDKSEGWIGDVFARGSMFTNGWFSDYYKDTYGQRPHLALWYYIHMLGLPMSQDTARTFCASPIENACAEAAWVRDQLETITV